VENELADYYSCIADYNDYRLHPAVFQWLDGVCGPTQSIDLLIQMERFNSKFFTTGTDAVDAFLG